MKNQLLKEMLVDTPETHAVVSPELHQNIMRKVRLAPSHDKRMSFGQAVSGWTVSGWMVSGWMVSGRAVSGWGAGVAVLALTIFYLVQTAPGVSAPGISAHSTSLVQTQKPAQAVSLMVLGNKLATFSEETLLPEKELMEEFERLKSDMARLGFRS